ncbi:7-carboxy-7-deazaguanine synthase QueE [Coxiella burnetii]|uniref:7-carboxy-7-deazaguanine synthase n=2 Tax=Coxiella burnetii TaxID=777 RepID=Q83F56_COXBU|nr:7-carboxy-7-deazaguanine synthase QueE [Coxiella burnetii]NP_819145.1 queuosine biosynthesis protein [Coxiella burnetii RSA 493]AAO89659.1 queuosine biosynthesis protein [Coxiella burnetii RSA 493]ABS77850.1 queuosine biosynthesis protein [Coxiella burnetii Dugway 5J108-111]ABX77727.1 radical SAM domain protein [Coxiella burnetii RSA 331]ACJ19169.1 queuosine biosynthesis protein [Coxiella burnetii CbuG_Q212]ACJ21070.1 queuosine biosynthesis protein [Coxiella burnetii CbuK_Q154]
MDKLRITEIFYSLQGETKTVGLPTVFVRLTGCPLRCHYCDTPYAFYGGQSLLLEDVVHQVASYQTRYVTVTGGEPLAQPACLPLLQRLCDLNYRVSLETSGALDISNVDPRVIKIVDVKTPGSKEMARNRFGNFEYLLPHDQVKFVICDRRDYEWAKDIINRYDLISRAEVLFSPSHEQLDKQQLADWIVEDRLSVRFQLQLHKYVWGDVRGK